MSQRVRGPATDHDVAPGTRKRQAPNPGHDVSRIRITGNQRGVAMELSLVLQCPCTRPHSEIPSRMQIVHKLQFVTVVEVIADTRVPHSAVTAARDFQHACVIPMHAHADCKKWSANDTALRRFIRPGTLQELR